MGAGGPRLVGVIHLPPLPGSPRAAATVAEVTRSARADAAALVGAGFDGIIVENFGDAPFFATRVPDVTIAAMTACVLAVREAAPDIAVGVNVLRNDAGAALAIAHVTGAAFVRVNVHTGARLTDQGLIEGEAATTLRRRRELGARVSIWADVDVKHSSPLAPGSLEQEVEDTALRGLADAILVTGDGTGKGTPLEKIARVRRAAGERPVYVASGATRETMRELALACHGIIVGTALRAGGIPGGPIDVEAARAFAEAHRSGGTLG